MVEASRAEVASHRHATFSSSGSALANAASADAYDPGVNKVLDSTDPELAPSGDDRDGGKDNILIGAKEQQ